MATSPAPHLPKIANQPGYEGRLMWATMGGFCPYPAVPNYSVTFPKPRPANTSAPAVSGKVKTVLHLSDIHVDPLYAVSGILVPRDAQPGTEANCQFPICCRDYENQTTPSRPALKWGDYFRSDWQSPSDIAPQDVWLANQASVTTTLTTIYTAISKHFATSNITKVFPAVGNHAGASYLACGWRRPRGRRLRVVRHSPVSGLKVIALNTNLCYIEDWWFYEKASELDPNGRFGGYNGSGEKIRDLRLSCGSIAGMVFSVLNPAHVRGYFIRCMSGICSYVNSSYYLFPFHTLGVWIVARTYMHSLPSKPILLRHTHLPTLPLLDVPPGSSDCFHNFAHFYCQIVQR
ncbi:hypothetical protein BC938DRAFT_472142 [Jimgerdemannia flammicorona]|uniref:Metallo-dependent phosphatase-like protein n=1 Tax=Jimgerdemannia flammicorona TaxID=994334 RepID=A0A433QU43_9FUNG|nr:hypothetical protein BC938DRAFT_472142 [Jimgerdemannia flammicorona]